MFQRREDGSVNFFRGWEAYRDGFGKLTGEHWLGESHDACLVQVPLSPSPQPEGTRPPRLGGQALPGCRDR